MFSNLSGPIIVILLGIIILSATIVFIFGKRQILRFTLKNNFKWVFQNRKLFTILLIKFWYPQAHLLILRKQERQKGDWTSHRCGREALLRAETPSGKWQIHSQAWIISSALLLSYEGCGWRETAREGNSTVERQTNTSILLAQLHEPERNESEVDSSVLRCVWGGQARSSRVRRWRISEISSDADEGHWTVS